MLPIFKFQKQFWLKKYCRYSKIKNKVGSEKLADTRFPKMILIEKKMPILVFEKLSLRFGIIEGEASLREKKKEKKTYQEINSLIS